MAKCQPFQALTRAWFYFLESFSNSTTAFMLGHALRIVEGHPLSPQTYSTGRMIVFDVWMKSRMKCISDCWQHDKVLSEAICLVLQFSLSSSCLNTSSTDKLLFIVQMFSYRCTIKKKT